MPYKLSWYIDRRVLLVEGCGVIDEIQLRRQALEIRDWLKDSIPPVHLLVDMSHLVSIVVDETKVQDITAPMYENTPLGWRLYFGSRDRAKRHLTSITSRLFHLRTAWFEHKKDALWFLASLDESLHLLTPSEDEPESKV
ncbi:MAG: hypothetical protein KJ064_24425 [Anaerolineae bacterium]|nr:hypothetical protein [Anaerolineae bacterium]